MTSALDRAPAVAVFAELVEADPDAPAVTCDRRTVTRSELDRANNRRARAFAELGVGYGDFVTIALPNSIEFIETRLATTGTALWPVRRTSTSAGSKSSSATRSTRR